MLHFKDSHLITFEPLSDGKYAVETAYITLLPSWTGSDLEDRVEYYKKIKNISVVTGDLMIEDSRSSQSSEYLILEHLTYLESGEFSPTLKANLRFYF